MRKPKEGIFNSFENATFIDFATNLAINTGVTRFL